METNLSPKNPRTIYSCKPCGYYTVSKKDYTKHIRTKKHSWKHDRTNLSSEKSDFLSCRQCEKMFLSRSGLWKHSEKCFQKCSKSPNLTDSSTGYEVEDTLLQSIIDENDKEALKSLVVSILKNNKELMKQSERQQETYNAMLKEQQKQNKELVDLLMVQTQRQTSSSQINLSQTIDSNNKTFNLHFFLNDTCKDAMNITEFVDQIHLKLTDLEKTGRDGYAEGVSSVLVRELKSVDITKRPIHCCDRKRDTLYIKENNVWEKEPEDCPNLIKAVHKIEHKNMLLLSAFQREYPDYDQYDSKRSTQYNQIMMNTIGIFDENEKRNVHNKIISKVSDATAIP